ncbi:GumC family protein [Thermodesulfobacteriota bacterium]
MEPIKSKEIDLRKYLRVLLKRKWIIISVFAVIVLATGMNATTVIPLYRGTARIVIEKRNPNLVSVQEVMALDAGGKDYLETQLMVIKSRIVAAEVIQRLDLENNPDFFPKSNKNFFANIKTFFNNIIQSSQKWLISLMNTEQRRKREVSDQTDAILKKANVFSTDVKTRPPSSGFVSKFIDRVNAKPVKGTRLVDVSFTAPEPKLAARIANELVQAYIDLNLEIRLKTTKNAIQWLSDRLNEERKKVEKAEISLLKYKDKEGILTDFSEGSEAISAQKLADLQARVVEAESVRVEAETRYQQARSLKNSEMLGSIPEVLNNEMIREIKKMEVNLYNRMSELSKKYGRNHPQMVAIKSELEDLKLRRKSEIQRIVKSLQSNYKLVLTKEASLKNVLKEQRQEIVELNQKAIRFRVLQRQAETSKHMYDLLINRFKETSLAEEMKIGNIRIIDEAEPRYGPININLKSTLKKTVMLGLILGIGLAFLLEYLDNTIKIPDEIKEYLNIPYLGPTPAFSLNENETRFHEDLVTAHSPKSTASESFRGIRSAILFSSADDAPQTILVTSAGPSEGKTFCATNLAVTMAQAGSRVVLLDCDMRRPRIHKILKARRDKGVSSIIVGKDPVKDAIVNTQIKNLDFIPVGPIPPNPSELLGSKNMKNFIEALRKNYTRIVIDSPPITAVTDAVVLSQAADGVILVVRAGDTPRQVVQNGLSQLTAVNSKILGAVLNGVDTGRDSYYYYQYYYYYYGDDGKDKKTKGLRKKKKPSPYG